MQEHPVQSPNDRFRENRRREPHTMVGLVRRLFNELSTLFRKEVALAKAEVADALSEAKVAAISMASGGAVMFAGILVLLAAAVLALSHVVAAWLAALIVGAVVTAVGYIMIHSGKKKLEPSTFKPERTQQSLQQDKEMLQRRLS
jgi:predicted phage tail protein